MARCGGPGVCTVCSVETNAHHNKDRQKPSEPTSRFVSKDGEVVTAYRLSSDNVRTLADWTGGIPVTEQSMIDPTDTRVGVNVKTDGGKKRASEGDWIAQFDNGKFEVMYHSEFSHKFSHPDDPMF